MPQSTQVAKWGNSLGLRLPKAIAQQARIEEGDTVEFSVQDGAILIRSTRPAYSLEDLVSRITPKNRHDETDWDKPAGREQW